MGKIVSRKLATKDSWIFSKSFKKQFDPEKEPIITITPRSWYKRYMVRSIDKNGFILVVEHDPSVKAFKFNWKASLAPKKAVRD